MRRLMRSSVVIESRQDLLKDHGLEDFSDFMKYSGGQVVSRKRGRFTVRFSLGDRIFYLKRYTLDLIELLKTLSRFRLPPHNALQEWQNVFAVKRIGILTVPPVAMGEQRLLGIEVSSFFLSEELYGAESLETLLRRDFGNASNPTSRKQKRSLIAKTAEIARTLHSHGMCHQDFYLSHLFLAPQGTLHLIDLQRVVKRKKTPRHSVVKDLGQLNYAADCAANLSRTDRLRFLLAYLANRSLGPAEKNLVKRINAKTARIARHTIKLLERRRRRGEVL